MKVIIFDVDWVIVKSVSSKKAILKKLLKKYKLFDIPWVQEILNGGMNRKLRIEKIYELVIFDREAFLSDLEKEYYKIETNPKVNTNVYNFIKNNYSKYDFFTNSALPIIWVNRILDFLDIKKYFKELLAFENWNKSENIDYILKKYNYKPEDCLFIDDSLNHIIDVKWTWINSLHFTDFNINLDKEIKKVE